MADSTKNPRSKRPDYSGTLFESRRTVGGKEYVYWRASGYFTAPNEAPKLIKAQGRTPQEASANLHDKINVEKYNFGLIGRDSLTMSNKAKTRTVGDVLAEWLTDRKNDPDLRLNSYKGYESKVRNYLQPHLGDVALLHVDHDRLHKFVWETLRDLKDDNGVTRLGTTAHRGVYTVLQLVLDFAVDRRYIDHNPVASVRIPKKNLPTKDDMKVFRELAQWVPQDVIAHATTPPQELRWMLALLGLRQSEVLGLTEDCIEWIGDPVHGSPRAIVVKQQLDRKTVAHGCGEYNPETRKWACGKQANNCPKSVGETEQFIRLETKTESGDRELPLDDRLRKAFKRHVAYIREVRTNPKFRPLTGDKMDTLLFFKDNGMPVRPQDDRRAWAKLLDDAHVTERATIPIRVHDARHFAATIAVQSQIAPDMIARIFGWSPRHVQDMIRIYAHPTSEILEEGIRTMGDRLFDRRDITPIELDQIRLMAEEEGLDAELIGIVLTRQRADAISSEVRENKDRYHRALKNAQVNPHVIESVLAKFVRDQNTLRDAAPDALTA